MCLLDFLIKSWFFILPQPILSISSFKVSITNRIFDCRSLNGTHSLCSFLLHPYLEVPTIYIPITLINNGSISIGNPLLSFSWNCIQFLYQRQIGSIITDIRFTIIYIHIKIDIHISIDRILVGFLRYFVGWVVGLRGWVHLFCIEEFRVCLLETVSILLL